MYGAILGDMIGSPYEFDRGQKTKDFPFFMAESAYTDDSVMTIAVAEALMDSGSQPEEKVKENLVRSMRSWGRRYMYAGNGAAMRVSSAGWLYDTLEYTRTVARWTAEVTHNHPEGIRGAEAAASAIFMARTGSSREEIREMVIRDYGYDLSRTCDQIRPGYHHVETCQKTVPEAITAFLEGRDFEDVIRTAVSLGGDCDTLTCIAGGIAEAYYGVPDALKQECRARLAEDMLDVLDRFDQVRKARTR